MVKEPIVCLVASTPDAQRLVAAAARNCYSGKGPTKLLDEMDDNTVEDLLRRVASMGHASLWEHASYTFTLENVSRSLLAEITRHRIASFSVKSQRYVKETQFDHIRPPTVQADEEAARLFDHAMEAAGEAYRALLDRGIPPEDARFVLPNACCTHIVVTMNARELLHFFKLRCCHRAQWEIRSVAGQMLALAREAAPLLFEKAGPACVWGACGEGTLSCGQADAVRRRYRDDV
ncbi:MAG: FAD-dependent thymidylate synthase [Oscillospiraceae bacterium]|jgi:thymidylate synthase (FAD)|nr:FAD-dependent thymidylate synthase [Oscillospiraceae bacterium]